MTKEFSKQTDVQMEIMSTSMIDLVGLSRVAVDIAPTHAVCSAAAPATCQRWYPIFLVKAIMIPPTTPSQHGFESFEDTHDLLMLPRGRTSAYKPFWISPWA